MRSDWSEEGGVIGLVLVHASLLVHLEATMNEEHKWFKSKPYLHFDHSMNKKTAVAYVTSSENVAKHSFLPLLHYTKSSRRYQKDPKTKKAYPTTKDRQIFYASHRDGYIYAFYAQELLKKYDTLLANSHLSSNILAYRRIEKQGKKFSNIEMASEAFNAIKGTGGCNILCLDITGFFDNLCPKKLKEKWCQTLNKSSLPQDHYNIYWNLTNFRFVQETDCNAVFGIEPRNQDLKGGSRANKICELQTLERLHKEYKADGKILVRKKKDLLVKGKPFKGIPQGTPISGLLANIFMFDFDVEMKKCAAAMNGHYWRYSDDIIFIFPTDHEFKTVESKIISILSEKTNSSLEINKDKTDRRIYNATNGSGDCINADTQKPSRVQYLGFTFDGKKVHIRNSSISRNRSKIANLVRQNYKGRGNINTKAVYKAQSLRRITPRDTTKSKGFVYYATRSSDAHGDDNSILPQVAKNDKFIKKKIAYERDKRQKRKPKQDK